MARQRRRRRRIYFFAQKPNIKMNKHVSKVQWYGILEFNVPLDTV